MYIHTISLPNLLTHSLTHSLLYAYPTTGKSIPTEIRAQARKLEHETDLDVAPLEETQPIDDEYANTDGREPKVFVCTSRDPSSRLKQFAK